MNYELAKELKEVGFPQSYEPICEHQVKMLKKGLTWGGYESMKHLKTCKKPGACIPTLSELIEACGDDFRWLKRRGKEWMAQGRPHPVGKKEPKAWGETPEIAVANLWLALNRKQP